MTAQCIQKISLYVSDTAVDLVPLLNASNDNPIPRKGGNMNIYVGNLSLDLTDDELRREFMAFGEVISVTIMNDKYIGSGQSRAYGFVEMPFSLKAKPQSLPSMENH